MLSLSHPRHRHLFDRRRCHRRESRTWSLRAGAVVVERGREPPDSHRRMRSGRDAHQRSLTGRSGVEPHGFAMVERADASISGMHLKDNPAAF